MWGECELRPLCPVRASTLHGLYVCTPQHGSSRRVPRCALAVVSVRARRICSSLCHPRGARSIVAARNGFWKKGVRLHPSRLHAESSPDTRGRGPDYKRRLGTQGCCTFAYAVSMIAHMTPLKVLPVGAHSRVRSPVLGSLQGHVPGPLPGSGASSRVGSAVPPGRGASSRVWGASSRPGSGPGSEPKTGGGEPGPGGWGTSSRAGGSHLPTGERAPRSPGPWPRNYLPDWHVLRQPDLLPAAT